MVIFRENTEESTGASISSGQRSGPRRHRVSQGQVSKDLKKSVTARRNPARSASASKPVRGPARNGSCARDPSTHRPEKKVSHDCHKGQHHEVHRRRLPYWAYDLAKKEFGGVEIDGGPWCKLPNGIIIKDAIADITLQQVLTRAEDFDVIATLNLNGDYLSDALAAQVGGIGIAPGQLQLHHGPRHLRGDPRHRAEVRR